MSSGDLEKWIAAVEKTGGKRKEQPSAPPAQTAKKAKGNEGTTVQQQVRQQAGGNSGGGLKPAERVEEVPKVTAPKPAQGGGRKKNGGKGKGKEQTAT